MERFVEGDISNHGRGSPPKPSVAARHQRTGRQETRSLWSAGAAGVQRGGLSRFKPLRLDNQLLAGGECGPP